MKKHYKRRRKSPILTGFPLRRIVSVTNRWVNNFIGDMTSVRLECGHYFQFFNLHRVPPEYYQFQKLIRTRCLDCSRKEKTDAKV